MLDPHQVESPTIKKKITKNKEPMIINGKMSIMSQKQLNQLTCWDRIENLQDALIEKVLIEINLTVFLFHAANAIKCPTIPFFL